MTTSQLIVTVINPIVIVLGIFILNVVRDFIKTNHLDGSDSWFYRDVLSPFITAQKKNVPTKYFSSLTIHYRSGRIFNWEVKIDEDENPKHPWRDFYNWFNGEDMEEKKFTIQYSLGESILQREEIVAVEVKKIEK